MHGGEELLEGSGRLGEAAVGAIPGGEAEAAGEGARAEDRHLRQAQRKGIAVRGWCRGAGGTLGDWAGRWPD